MKENTDVSNNKKVANHTQRKLVCTSFNCLPHLFLNNTPKDQHKALSSREKMKYVQAE